MQLNPSISKHNNNNNSQRFVISKLNLLLLSINSNNLITSINSINNLLIKSNINILTNYYISLQLLLTTKEKNQFFFYSKLLENFIQFHFNKKNLNFKFLFIDLLPINYKKNFNTNINNMSSDLNYFNILTDTIKSSNSINLSNNIITFFNSIDKKKINDDLLAYFLSQILSPNFNLITTISITDLTKIGIQISKFFSKNLINLNLNWNRIFNLMSTKYFFNIDKLNITLNSLNFFLSILSFDGKIIDSFFLCDWNLNFKLQIFLQIHNWNLTNGCLDLLTIPTNLKKINSNILGQNSKHSLLYLISISNLSLQLFIQRDELNSKTFLEKFFDDINFVPELLCYTLIQNSKNLKFLIDEDNNTNQNNQNNNDSQIDELIVTLLVQVFEKSPSFLKDLIDFLPDDNNKLDKLFKITKILLINYKKNLNLPLSNWFKILLNQKNNSLDSILNNLSFDESLELLPIARKCGWNDDLFKSFINKNLSNNNDEQNFKIILKNLNNQINFINDINLPFRSSKIFDLNDLNFLITTLINFPISSTSISLIDEKNYLQFNLILNFPRLINFGLGHDDAILSNGDDLTPIHSDIEKDMQNYLQKMYSGDLQIKDIIDILKNLQKSDIPRDQDIFACMIHAIIAESTFFKDYPIEALATTSVLFGSLILFQLIKGVTLNVALNIILNFAKEPLDSKMFKFAIQAIYAFKIRLIEFPQYCKDLLKHAPHLSTQQQIYQSIKESASQEISNTNTSSNNNNESSSSTIPNPNDFINLKFLNFDNALLVNSSNSANPPKESIERILFIVNNLTLDNFGNKISNLKQLLNQSNFYWFSNYLINQRVKTEPNNHKLYSNIIISVNSKLFHALTINLLLKNLFYLLSTKDISNIDKNSLKNFSSFLGLITIAMDKPILHKNLAIKELLLNSYIEKRLEVVIPFVTKFLQNASLSKIFRPPNPWTVGIIKILLELDKRANLKLSLTFEIEVLMKALGLPMNSFEPSEFLTTDDASKLYQLIDEMSGNTPNNLSPEQQNLEQRRQMILMQQYQQQLMIVQQQQRHLQQQQQNTNQLNSNINGNLNSALANTNVNAIPENTNNPKNLVESTINNNTNNNTTNNNIIDNPFSKLLGTTIFVTHPDLRRVFQMAIAKSVRELLLPTVEKSSGIAVITTTKIILKDFATEVDEFKIETAAITMTRQLAQSLARSTSIDLLKDSIRQTTHSLAPNLGNMLQQPNEELDRAINDNLPLALVLIEKASMDKATKDINELLAQPLAIRQYHKERRADQPFLAQNTNPYSLTLPEPLGLNRSGVTPYQFALYENFGKVIHNPNAPGAAVVGQQQKILPQVVQQQQQPLNANNIPNANNVPNNNTNQTQQIIANLRNESEHDHRILVNLMDTLVAQIKEHAKKESLSDLGEQNSIKEVLLQILTCIAQSNQTDQLAMKVAQAVVNSLFATSESSLCREVLSLLLEKLCSLSMVARKDVIWWLIYSMDVRKFNLPVMKSLLKIKLTTAIDLDKMLTNSMVHEMENAVSFAVSLLRDMILCEGGSMQTDFINSIKYLSQNKQNNPEVKSFLKDFSKKKVPLVSKGTKITKTERYYLVFTEWVKLIQKVDENDEIVLVFIKQLVDKNVISTTDGLVEFLRSSLELAVFSFKESDPTGEVFTSIDAIVKFIIKLFSIGEFKEYSKKQLLDLFLSIVTMVFAADHEKEGNSFNERPYFRLFSNLLCEWQLISGHQFIKIQDLETRKELIEFEEEFFSTIAQYLHSIQPIAFPGFSFAWITLISHRMFLPIMLRLKNKSGWKNLSILLIDLIKFMEQYTNKNSVPDAISVVYKGALRVFLGISNDVPEYLIENHYELMNHLPPTYFQLKNAILSAIPKKMMVPNPYQPALDMKDLEICQEQPNVFYNPINDLQLLKKPVDNYLRIPSNSLLRTIVSSLYKKEYEKKNGVGYDFLMIDSKLVRAIILHVGIEAGLENERTSSSAIFNTGSSYYSLIFDLVNEGTTELRYQILQTIIEQLRYPNIHTYWFSFVIKNLFISKEWSDEEKKQEIQELILRNVLERIIVNKPHAWGVTVLVMDFLQSKDINLLEYPFINEVPEIKTIFEQLVKHVSKLQIQGNEKEQHDDEVSSSKEIFSTA